MLVVKDIDVYYGAIHALKKVSINVEQGSIVTLIGANGAGKSTTLKTISGLIRPKSGSITFKGKKLPGFYPRKLLNWVFPRCRRKADICRYDRNGKPEMGAFRRKTRLILTGILKWFSPVFPA